MIVVMVLWFVIMVSLSCNVYCANVSVLWTADITEQE